MNIGAESATHMEESLTFRRCQVDKLDCPNIGNIDHISKCDILSWQEMLRRGGQPTEVNTDLNIDYNQQKSNSSGHPDSLIGILSQ